MLQITKHSTKQTPLTGTQKHFAPRMRDSSGGSTSGWFQCVFYCSVSRLSYFKMAHNYIVTAHKPTAVSACETGKKSRFGYILCMFFKCVLFIILQNSFATSMAPPN